MRVIFSTNNNHKLKEMRKILKDTCVLSLFDLGIDINPEEIGNSYNENSYIKVKACFDEMLKKKIFLKDDIIVADDSGLSVDALNGAPGIYSKRFGNFDDNSLLKCEYLLKLMEQETNRKAKFVCVLCVLFDNKIKYFDGEINGEISHKMYGNCGFGYDPIFYIKEFGKTMAELSEDEKNKISHRKVALDKFLLFYNKVLLIK